MVIISNVVGAASKDAKAKSDRIVRSRGSSERSFGRKGCSLNPEVTNGMFAVAGAVIGAIGTGVAGYVLHRVSKRNAQIAIIATKPERLLSVDSKVAGRVKVLLDETPIDELYNFEVRVTNTGNVSIESVQVSVDVECSGELLGAELIDVNFEMRRDEGGAAVATGTICVLALPYLNPRDSAVVRIMTSARPAKVHPRFRQRDVGVKVRVDYEPFAAADAFAAEMVTAMVSTVPVSSLRRLILSTLLK